MTLEAVVPPVMKHLFFICLFFSHLLPRYTTLQMSVVAVDPAALCLAETIIFVNCISSLKANYIDMMVDAYKHPFLRCEC